MAGMSQPVTVTQAAVAVPAHPSRARMAAVVQVGAAPAAANTAAPKLRN